ncbi:nitrous oxide reductase accessory protein NosL [Thermodesulfobacteriota bacterium]
MFKRITVHCLILVVALLSFSSIGVAEPVVKIKSREKCPVCGMFVAKYDAWITQVHHHDKSVSFFDGVKDMMAYVFNPQHHGAHTSADIGEIWVKDYYTLDWIDGRTAFFVLGSDVYGPMGHELIPFQSREAAGSFLKDHHGKEILPFAEISATIVESLRSGHKMK